MRYKVGDEVVIRDDVSSRNIWCEGQFVCDQAFFGGKLIKVENIVNNEYCYKLVVKNAWFCFNDEMIDHEKTAELNKVMTATPTFLENSVENNVEKCKSESVNHPEHYGCDTLYEAIKVIEAWELGFCLGNAVKYISRAGKKDKTKEIEDLKKAVWYINRHIGKLENESV